MLDIQKEINKLKGLSQYKNKSDEELEQIVRDKLEKKELEKFSFCANDEEEKFCKDLLKKYTSQRSFENEAEKDTLKQLICQQLIAERLQSILKTEYAKANPSVPLQIVEQLDAVTERIENLKDKLGLTNKDGNNISWQEEWDLLKKKALKYFEEHKGCNEFKCPYCQNIFHLLWDRTNYKEIKSTWFKGTMLYNKPLLELYDNKKISKEDVARVLGVHEFYIDLIYELYLREKQNDREN